MTGTRTLTRQLLRKVNAEHMSKATWTFRGKLVSDYFCTLNITCPAILDRLETVKFCYTAVSSGTAIQKSYLV